MDEDEATAAAAWRRGERDLRRSWLWGERSRAPAIVLAAAAVEDVVVVGLLADAEEDDEDGAAVEAGVMMRGGTMVRRDAVSACGKWGWVWGMMGGAGECCPIPSLIVESSKRGERRWAVVVMMMMTNGGMRRCKDEAGVGIGQRVVVVVVVVKRRN